MDSQLAPDTVMLPETGVTAELYRAAIGPSAQEYYLKHFIRFDALGKTTATWHWPAYWATLNWLIYRSMWRWAALYAGAVLGLALLIFGVGKLLFSYTDITALILFLSLLTTAFVVPGMYANAWFYKFCNEKISATLRSTAEVKDASDALSAQASGKQRWLALVGTNIALLALLAGLVTFVFEAAPDSPAVAATAKPPDAPLALLAQHVAPTGVELVAAAAMPGPVAPVVAPVAAPQVEAVSAPAAVASAPASESLAPVRVVTSPVVAPTPAVPAVAASAAESAASPAAPAVVRRPKPKKAKMAKPVVAEKAVAAAEPAEPAVPAVAVAATPPVKRHWLVQVGAFSQEANAQSVRVKIQEAGLQTMAETGDASAEKLIRVRVGPFDTKADAEKAAVRLRELELPTVLVRQ